LSQITYLKIISGQAPSLLGVPARAVLTLLSWPYAAAVRVRNHLYSTGRLKAHRAGVPVLCVGNLTTGGTGKTPLVVWLCRYLQERQVRGAILTRGYKMRKGTLSDEPALLSAQCSGVAVVVNPDRVAGAAEAVRRHGAQVLVMDDGFQHRRLARDLDIVAIDATQPSGCSSMGVPPRNSHVFSLSSLWNRVARPNLFERVFPCDGTRHSEHRPNTCTDPESRARCPCHGKVLPAGLLREPVTGLRRVHAVVLTRCDQVSEETLKHIEDDVRRINPDLVVARSIHAPVAIKTREGPEIGLDQLRSRRIFAFCGIGNPESFFHAIEHLGGVLAGAKVCEDHYRYASGDLEQIYREAAAGEASLILTTQKDWTKISRLADPRNQPPLAYLAIDLQITAGAEELTALLDRVLGGIMPIR